MLENVGNIFERINEITARIRDIQNLGYPQRQVQQPDLPEPATAPSTSFSELLNSSLPGGEAALNLLGETETGGLDLTEDLTGDALFNSSMKADALALIKLLGKQQNTPNEVNTNDIVEAAAKTYGLDARLLRAVIQQESGYNPQAVSPKGAMGLMQLMPETAKALGVTDPFDAYQNIFGGAGYLKQMMDKYGDVNMALAAYNAGPQAVDFYGDIPPFEETQSYVKNIIAMIKMEE